MGLNTKMFSLQRKFVNSSLSDIELFYDSHFLSHRRGKMWNLLSKNMSKVNALIAKNIIKLLSIT